MKALKLMLIVIFAACISSAAYAAPLTVVESTDFANINSGTIDLGSFDIGLNTVSGSVDRNSTPGAGSGDYGDFWDATVPTGMYITSIEIVISNHHDQLGFFVGAADNIIGGFGPFTSQAYTDLLADGTYSLAATIGSYPFGPGQYYFGAATNVGTETGYDYEWRVTVEGVSVPEPSILVLFCGGLLMLPFVRRYWFGRMQ